MDLSAENKSKGTNSPPRLSLGPNSFDLFAFNIFCFYNVKYTNMKNIYVFFIDSKYYNQ